MPINPLVPIILCGGSGTRLWPLSRKSFPKQYLSINSDKNKSLLQMTKERLVGLENITNPILICNEEHRFIVAEQMRQLNTKPLAIILEPFGRNTAPAITLAAIKALEIYSDPLILILSSDHEIKNIKKFQEVIHIGLNYAKTNHLVTFGIIPTSPEIGYGYIKADSPFSNNEIIGKSIKRFIEKPDLKTAKSFLKDKSFTWNSGIFIFRAKSILKEIKTLAPEILDYCQKSISDSQLDLEFQRIDKKYFFKCPNISIDIAIMEKTKKGIVLPLDAGWSDIGSWKSVWEKSKKDNNENFISGKVLVDNTEKSYLRSENRLIVGIGLKDLIVIETDDAILISHKNETQKVKDIVKKLKARNIPEGQNHSKIFRPWGHYVSICGGPKWQLKLINVKPGEQLSLQLHKFRSEHWIVVSGTAKVEIEGEIDFLKENQSIYIPLGSKHRLSNPIEKPLKIIEVQSGSYIGEDDIVRFDDKYGRSK